MNFLFCSSRELPREQRKGLPYLSLGQASGIRAFIRAIVVSTTQTSWQCHLGMFVHVHSHMSVFLVLSIKPRAHTQKDLLFHWAVGYSPSPFILMFKVLFLDSMITSVMTSGDDQWPPLFLFCPNQSGWTYIVFIKS